MTSSAGPWLWSLAVLCLACDTRGAGSVDAKQVFPDPAIAALAEAAAAGDSALVRELVRAGADTRHASTEQLHRKRPSGAPRQHGIPR